MRTGRERRRLSRRASATKLCIAVSFSTQKTLTRRKSDDGTRVASCMMGSIALVAIGRWYNMLSEASLKDNLTIKRAGRVVFPL